MQEEHLSNFHLPLFPIFNGFLSPSTSPLYRFHSCFPFTYTPAKCGLCLLADMTISLYHATSLFTTCRTS